MKSLVPALIAAMLLSVLPCAQDTLAQSSPKKLYAALGSGDKKEALAIAGEIPDVNYSNKYGATPLMCSAEAGALEVSGVLLDRGADPDLR